MNRQIRKLAFVLMACYAMLFVRLNFLQVVNADTLNDRGDNGRKLARDFNQPRGDIVAADGSLIATRTATEATRQSTNNESETS